MPTGVQLYSSHGLHFLTRRCRRLSATSGESLMWNIRLHSCCRTPSGVAARKFSWSVGGGNRGERKRKNEPSCHAGECAAGGSHAGVRDLRFSFTLFNGIFLGYRFYQTWITASTIAAVLKICCNITWPFCPSTTVTQTKCNHSSSEPA